MRTILRTRFSKDILTEFLPPRQVSHKVAIVLGGLPSAPSKSALLTFLSNKNYWSFYPRYRGTWESTGEFLKKSPLYDLFDLLKSLEHEFQALWTKEKYSLQMKECILISSSFGGFVSLEALAHREVSLRISKVVCFSPVTDWALFSKQELEKEVEFLHEGYGPAYRYKKSSLKKLFQGYYGNPASNANKIQGSKLLAIQAKDDKSVPWKSVMDFVSRVGAKSLLVKKGGHFGVAEFMNPVFYPKIQAFLKNKNPSA